MVPLRDAASSLRWARRLITLTRRVRAPRPAWSSSTTTSRRCCSFRTSR
ncbi:hypothetical protein NKH77_06705 [Streptomyces sp. M19]